LSSARAAQEVTPIIAPTNNPKFGDYQCNNAMPLFATMKGKEDAPYKNPRELAQAVMDALPESPLIVETSIAGPGFINAKVRNLQLQFRVVPCV
jgi:arginyl-tRNA synthetase